MNHEDLEAFQAALDREARKDARDEGAPAPAPVAKGMNAYERFACAQYLSAFPDDVTFNEVLQMLLDRNDEVLVWEVFEHHKPEFVLDLIVWMVRDLGEQFVPRKEAR
jgi:hypothetical protein